MNRLRIRVIIVLLSGVSLCHAVSVLYETGFESPDYAAASLIGQNGWSGANAFVIRDSVKAYEGQQVVRLGLASGSSGYTTSAEFTGEPETGRMTVQCMLNHGNRLNGTQLGDTSLEIYSNDGVCSFRMLFKSATHTIQVQNGTVTQANFAEDTWYQVTVVIDQDVSPVLANFYLDDVLVAGDVGSLSSTPLGLKKVTLRGGASVTGWPSNDHYSYVDALSITHREDTSLSFPCETGFEPLDWQVGDAVGQHDCTGNSVVVASDAGKAYEGTQMLRLGSSNGYSGNIYFNGLSGEPEVGGFDISVMLNHGDRQNGAQSGDTVFEVMDDSGYRAFRVTLRSEDQKVLVQDGVDTGFSFLENTWYEVRIKISQNGSLPQKGDVYLDGHRIAAGLASEYYSGIGVGSLHIGSGANCGGWPSNDHYGYVDNLRLDVIPVWGYDRVHTDVPDDAWLVEGEDVVLTNFIYGPQSLKPTMLGEGYLNLNTFVAADPCDLNQPWYASWVFQVPQAGSYDIWMLDYPFAGTFRWSLNGGASTARTVYDSVSCGLPAGSSRYYCDTWRRLTPTGGIAFSEAGVPQHLRIEVMPVVQGADLRAGCYLDAIAIVPVGQSPAGWCRVQNGSIVDSFYGIHSDVSFSANEAYRVIEVQTDEVIDNFYQPSADRWAGVSQVERRTAKGQSQNFSVAVYAQDDLGDVDFSISAFSNGTETLPAADLRLVRMWQQRQSYSSDSVGYPLPELLEPAVMTRIDAYSFRQLWVTVEPPISAAAGTYTANLTINPSRGDGTTISLNLEVYPFELEFPQDKTLGAIWYGQSHNWWVFNETTTRADYAAQLADMAKHGMKALFFCDTPNFIRRENGSLVVYSGFDRSRAATLNEQVNYNYLAEGEVGIDLTEFLAVIDQMHTAGFDGPLVQYQSLKRPIAYVTDTPLDEIGWHASANVGAAFTALLTEAVEQIDAAVAARGYDPIYYVMDDEVHWGGEYRMSGYMNLATIVHDAGGLQTVSMAYSQAAEELAQLRTVLSFPVGNGSYEEISAQDSGHWQGQLGSYSQLWTPDYSYERRKVGVWFWAYPLRYYFGHCYQGSVGDPFDDFDGTTPDMNVTYPSAEGGDPIPTLQWEGFRQGFYDLCYLHTLRSRLEQLPEGKAKNICQTAMDAVNAIIQSYASSGGALDALSKITAAEIRQIRSLIAEALAVGTGSIDLNTDGAHNLEDFSVFSGQWHTHPQYAAGTADFDFDGDVDLLDLVLFAQGWLTE